MGIFPMSEQRWQYLNNVKVLRSLFTFRKEHPTFEKCSNIVRMSNVLILLMIYKLLENLQSSFLSSQTLTCG